MNHQHQGLPRTHTYDRMRSAGRPSGHVHPYVRALPSPTAHPAADMGQRERFAHLQERFAATSAAGSAAHARSMVVLPSRSVDRWHEPPAETRSYEERLLSFLLDLRDPALELTYVTSLPVAQRTIDYHIALLPRRVRLSARKRLRLVSISDGRARPLSEKLRKRPDVLEQIRRTITDPRVAYLMPYNSTGAERDIALALDIPLFSADPDHAWLGTKSGSRTLFASAGVPHPLGRNQVRTAADAVEAIRALRRAKPLLGEVVIKLDYAVSGEGNAVLDLAGLPAPGTPDEAALIAQRFECLVPDAAGVTPAAYLGKLNAQGGVVEERISGHEVRSPSVQLEITPAGEVTLLSTHDQILRGRNGQQFAGCRFPADPAYAPLISALAQRIAERLADTGVIGRLAIDFLVTRGLDNGWQPFALEVNLRMGGTTHPYQTLVRLTGGSYDPQTASFKMPGGDPRHYVSTDHLKIPQMPVLGHGGLLARAARAGLHFDHNRGRGVVYHMLSSVESLATVGVTAIADTPHTADELYARVRTVLARAARERTPRGRRMRAPAALEARRAENAPH